MIRLLEWDSSFFGFKTGSVHINQQTDFNSLKLNDFKFVYLFSNELITDDQLQKEQIRLISTKVTYQKYIDQKVPVNEDSVVSFEPTSEIPESLLEIVIQSGHYSRFHIDNRIPDQVFRNLYKAWILNSVSRTIADEVYVFKQNGSFLGFVTLGLKQGIPNIGLIAVDASVRSLGIGRTLIGAAGNWAFNIKGKTAITVVTQEANLGACSFYEKNGYSPVQKEYVYHWWNPDAENSGSF